VNRELEVIEPMSPTFEPMFPTFKATSVSAGDSFVSFVRLSGHFVSNGTQFEGEVLLSDDTAVSPGVHFVTAIPPDLPRLEAASDRSRLLELAQKLLAADNVEIVILEETLPDPVGAGIKSIIQGGIDITASKTYSSP
jgi:hypothetical protein